MSDIKLGRIYKRKKEHNHSIIDIYIVPVEIQVKAVNDLSYHANDVNYYKIHIIDKDIVQELYRESYLKEYYDLVVSDE